MIGSSNKRWARIGVILGTALACVLIVRSCVNRQTGELADLSPRATKRDRPIVTPVHPVRHLPVSVGKFESDWLDSQTGDVYKVRKLYRLEAIPTVIENASRVTATVDIDVVEAAEIWRPKTRSWEEMTSGEFERWREGMQDKHTATAMLIKEHDPKRGETTIVRQLVTGEGAKEPASRYNETENGINISAEWKGDTLAVGWAGAGTKRQVELVKVALGERFREETQGAPSDGAKPPN